MAETAESLKAEKGHLHMFFLVALETVLSTLLKTDPDSQHLLKLLIEKNAVIQIDTHLPAERFYITFSPHGVLLDYKKPEQSVIGKVSGSFPDMIRAFFSPSQHVLTRIRVEGEPVVLRQLEQLMQNFNLPNVIKSVIKSFWFGFDQDTNADKTPPRRIKELLRKIDDQKKQLEQLTIQNHTQAYQAKKKQRKLSIGLFVLTIYSVLMTMVWALSNFLN